MIHKRSDVAVSSADSLLMSPTPLSIVADCYCLRSTKDGVIEEGIVIDNGEAEREVFEDIKSETVTVYNKDIFRFR